MSSPRGIATGLIIAILAGLAGFAAYRWQAQSPLRHRNADVPELVPNISLPDIDGRLHALSEWKGHPLLINFWATWCAPCRKEIPLLKKLREDYAPRGLEVIGIAIDFKDAVAGYTRQAGIQYPVLVAQENATVMEAFGLGSGLPVSVLVSRSGRIVAVKPGQLHEDRAAELLKKALEAP